MEVKEHLSVALAQYDIVWESSSENCKKVEKLLEECRSEIDILVLPEAFNTGFSMNPKQLAETMDGATITWMKELSASKNIAVCGSLFILENEKYYNRFCWVEPDGEIITYDKRHLFSMGDEDQSFTHGTTQALIDHKGWKLFPQICYDLRFPVWSRNIHNYDLLINVANWPAPRNEVWKTLLKARSIENQCYTVAVNRIGIDGMNINYSGNSVVIDPKGIKLFNAHHREIIETVSLDYQALHHFREKFNVLKDLDHFTISG